MASEPPDTAATLKTSNNFSVTTPGLTTSPRRLELSDAGGREDSAVIARADRADLSDIASAGLKTSPRIASKSLRAVSPGYSTPFMTAAAAQADHERMQLEQQNTQKSRNPATTALGALLGHGLGMSRPQDAPTVTTTLGEGSSITANVVTVSESMQIDSHPQISPVSISSIGSFNSTGPSTLVTSTSNPNTRSTIPVVEAIGRRADRTPAAALQSPALDPGEVPNSNRAFTFPGPILPNPSDDEAHTPQRGMSLPIPRSGPNSARSPSSNRKHKCPYCSTDFTRHHNLKSHLLTHSHEKPFVCSTCNLRFRRLHDLKRHNKLHTGERPHVCVRCDRSFARGDALARHIKGHGGCAGRRSSMGSGSFVSGNGDYDEGSHDGAGSLTDLAGRGGGDSMDGLVYTSSVSNDADRPEDEGAEAGERPRRLSLPGIQRLDRASTDPSRQDASLSRSGPHAPGSSVQQPGPMAAAPHPSTYPPTVRPGGGLPASPFHPPSARMDRSGATLSPSLQVTGFSTRPTPPSGSLHLGSPLMFSQSSITESPKPLSPGAVASHQLGHGDAAGTRRKRSPSLSEQLRNHQYSGRSNSRNAPTMGLPPLSSSAHAPRLPSLAAGLGPPDSRYTLSSQAGGVQQHQARARSSGSGDPYASKAPGGPPPRHPSPLGGLPSGSTVHGDSASSHTVEGSSVDGSNHIGSSSSTNNNKTNNNLFATGTDGLWAYIRNLEERVNSLMDEVATLRKACQHSRPAEPN